MSTFDVWGSKRTRVFLCDWMVAKTRMFWKITWKSWGSYSNDPLSVIVVGKEV